MIGSALMLGFYDVCKKHAVKDNSVSGVLFWATALGTLFFLGLNLLSGGKGFACTPFQFAMIFLKGLIVGSSWGCVYYSLKQLPISIVAPIRAGSPVLTFLGGVLIFHEIPSLMQGGAMLLIFGGCYLFSVLGKLEGIHFLRSRSIFFLLAGTALGAVSALYDKYLLNTLAFPRETVQLYASIDIALILGVVRLFRRKQPEASAFEWRWTILLTGCLVVISDYLYFYALSLPEVQVSLLSLVRRSNCIVSFAVGAWLFHDKNIKAKAWALILILLGLFLLTQS